MKNNKKGFTLVELLAVIVILGVLLLIAVPAVNNIINTSKRNAFEKQAMLALENVETMISVNSDKITSACVIKLSDISLERGTWTGYNGKVNVSASGDATITISNDKFSITDKALTAINGVDGTYAAATTPTTTTCTWWN